MISRNLYSQLGFIKDAKQCDTRYKWQVTYIGRGQRYLPQGNSHCQLRHDRDLHKKMVKHVFCCWRWAFLVAMEVVNFRKHEHVHAHTET